MFIVHMNKRTYFAIREHSVQVLGTENLRILMGKHCLLTISRRDIAEEIAVICNKSVKLRLGEFAKFYTLAEIPKPVVSVPVRIVHSIPEFFTNLDYD